MTENITGADVLEFEGKAILSKKKTEFTSNDVIEYLRCVGGYIFSLKESDDTLECNGQRMTDYIESEIRLFCRDHGVKGGKDYIRDCILKAAAANAFHPIKRYLEKVEYRGNGYIRDLSDYFTCAGPNIRYSDGHIENAFYVYLKRFLVGCVAKTYKQFQNNMLVLVGGQGVGKSCFAGWISSGIKEYFIEASLYGNDKDNDINSISNFIWEVSELDATTRKADVSALKAFISREIVTVRAPYGRFSVKKPALANFIGTVNPGSGFLNDETGNRRFMCVEISNIDFGYSKMDVSAVWAEAFQMFKSGESAELLPDEKEYQAIMNSNFDAENPLEGWIDSFFEITGQKHHFMKTSEIIDELRRHNVVLHGHIQMISVNISKAMKKLGISKGQRNGQRGYIGIRELGHTKQQSEAG